jgi:glutamine amidotransferase
MIIIIDYGMGNLRSVSKALESLGASVRISSNPQEVGAAEKLILPGVGAFPAAMQELQARRLVEPIRGHIASGKPYLGICLGLQLLFDRSEEGEGAAGLGVLRGAVKRLSVTNGLKIPHMGWNQIQRQGTRDKGQECPLLRGVPNESFVYFVHSYVGQPDDSSMIACRTAYGAEPFASMLWRDNLFATQFHPEKSQAVGLKLLKNFIDL